MLFNSFEFILFLPIVFLLYWFVFKKNLLLQNSIILISSYFFYGWWSWGFMGLLVISTLLDYSYGFGVASNNKKKAKFFLWLSIINNLGILGVFKYYNFFADQFKSGMEVLGFYTNPIILELVLPVGISFYTFHGMSYVFDVYRGKQKPIGNFIDYAVFVSLFPLLVAGPIERASHLLPQVQTSRFFSYKQASEGCKLILWGLFKKVIIADGLAPIVNNIFQNYQNLDGLTLVIGAIAFSFQIYGDFSGYSDIAIGTAKLFGFELLTNFKFPYFSRDLAEFWRRWHISLSSWFRDYLYIPLGGSKNGKLIAIRNTFIIFLVSGFWHGASWNFLIWGAIHAFGFLPLLLLNKNRVHTTNVVAEFRKFPTLNEFFKMIVTFSFVTIAWIFFRFSDLASAFGYIKKVVYTLFSAPNEFFHIPQNNRYALLLILITIICDWYLRRDERSLKVPIKNRIIRYAFYILLICLIHFKIGRGDNSFIYFQF